MAAEVASAIQPSIRRAEVERARSKRPENLAAYDMVMRALHHLWSHNPADNLEAIGLLERALAIEPTYGLAAALAAWARGQQVAYSWTTDLVTALATAMMQLGGNVADAVGFVDKALALDPNLAWGWMRRGFGLVYLGRPDEGLVSLQRAERLSPLDPFAFNFYIGMGLAHFAAERPAEAIQFARRALAERPGLTWPFRDLAAFLAQSGDLAAARDALEKFRRDRPDVTLAALGDGLRFMYPSLLSRYLRGLKLAGLD
jgi:tetratricopeptide (TPR) repeat protein